MTTEHSADPPNYNRANLGEPEHNWETISFDLNEPTYVVIKHLLQYQFDQATMYIPQIKAGIDEIEAVHKTRVGFRRLRSQLRIVKEIFKKKKLKYLRLESRDFGRTLGVVRDLDVLKINLQSYFRINFSGDGFEQRIWEPLFQNEYHLAKTRLIDHLNRKEFNNFLSYFYIFCSDMELGIKNQERWEKAEPVKLMDYIQTQLIDKIQLIQNQQANLSVRFSDSSFHKLRIDIKRFRYTLDFFSPLLLATPTQTLIETLTTLQDHLGLFNDYTTAIRILDDIEGQLETKTSSYITDFISSYKNVAYEEKEKLQNSFPGTWNAYRLTNPQRLIQNCTQQN